jgi:hypothetical protein
MKVRDLRPLYLAARRGRGLARARRAGSSPTTRVKGAKWQRDRVRMTLAVDAPSPQSAGMADNHHAVPPQVSPKAGPRAERFALVWIDSERATILRWHGRAVAETLVSDVPPHVRSTAHVRHDPSVRHGGSGRGQDDAERRRNEHLRSFLRAVADRLGDDDRIEILGTGTVGERLAALIRRRTARRHSPPSVEAFNAMPLTPRQMAAHLRQRLGLGDRRRTVGAYRWSGELPRTRSGALIGPRGVLKKSSGSAGPDTKQE